MIDSTTSEGFLSAGAQDERGDDEHNQARNMTDTTLTMSALRGQTPVAFVDDPSKPSWEDFLSARMQDEQDRRSAPPGS